VLLQGIGGDNDWIGWLPAGSAWVYRSSGFYRSSGPSTGPDPQGVPYGESFSKGDNVTAIMHDLSTLEFLVNGTSQGRINLSVPLPADAVGCVNVCGGGVLALEQGAAGGGCGPTGAAEIQLCDETASSQQWSFDAGTETVQNEQSGGFLGLPGSVLPAGLNFAPAMVNNCPSSWPLFWAPPTYLLRVDNHFQLSSVGGTMNACLGVCGSA
jgi:hypothetical protein